MYVDCITLGSKPRIGQFNEECCLNAPAENIPKFENQYFTWDQAKLHLTSEIP